MSVYNRFSILEGGKKGVFDRKRRNEGMFPCILRGIVRKVFLWAIVGGFHFGVLGEGNDTLYEKNF